MYPCNTDYVLRTVSTNTRSYNTIAEMQCDRAQAAAVLGAGDFMLTQVFKQTAGICI